MSDGVNIPLLRKAVEWAEAEALKPEIDREWDQSSWRADPYSRVWVLLRNTDERITEEQEEVLQSHCGTAYCIAGWVAQTVDERYAHDIAPDGMPHVAEFAGKVLGLPEFDRWRLPEGHLFREENSIEDVRRIAEEIAGERL